MFYAETAATLIDDVWCVGFMGDSANDDRSTAAMDYVTKKTKSVHTISYNPKDFTVLLDDKCFDKDDINNELKHILAGSILIDATTLDFAELLILLQSLKDLSINSVSILYIEPKSYKRKKSVVSNILHRRDFELSEEVIGYEAIPGHALMIRKNVKQKSVFLCGYEEDRFERAMEDHELLSVNCCCIFGVPAFVSGWEMNSFDNNIRIIKSRNVIGGVSFCGATNPLSVYLALEQIYRGLDEDEEMFVVPLSTKPINLGACLFLLEKPKERVAVLYDHPRNSKATDIAKWHLFNVKFN